MKKIKTQLQLKTTTVRVLAGTELTGVHGGIAGTSANPNACAAGAYRVGTSANPNACAELHGRGTSANPNACATY